MNTSVIFFMVAVLVVGVLLFGVVSVTRNKGVVLDQEEYQTRWLKIEQSLVKEEAASYGLAILEADKLLDHALNELGIPGNTMAERLKKVSGRFTNSSSVRYAHRLRNQIAHEHGFEINYEQAKRALATFRQAIKDIGAI